MAEAVVRPTTPERQTAIVSRGADFWLIGGHAQYDGYPLDDRQRSLLRWAVHAIQYMPFVLRVERKGDANQDPSTAHAKLTLAGIGLVVTGTLAFEIVPQALDASLGTGVRLNALFFVAAFMLFLNLHHYCIDAVSWRVRDPKVRAVLM